MAVRVARRCGDGAVALFRDGEKMMWMRGSLHGVDRDLHVAVGAVLETDRAGDARGELAVHLAFGRACADRAPRHEVCDVLRRDDVEEFTARRQAEAIDVEQE